MVRQRSAFSLVELIIVLVILGIVAAIAIPRMSRGADGADVTGMQADLAVLRNAVEMYRAEHGAYPAATSIATALTRKTDKDGTVNATGAFGPYIAVIPPLKTGAKRGQTAFGAPDAVPPTVETDDVGWLYDQASGSIWPNDINHFNK